MKYRFYLDDALYDEPIGWDKFVTNIKRDKTLKGLLSTVETQFTFTGAAYTYMRGLLDDDGFCSQVSVNIKQECDGQNYIDFYDGIIFTSDIVFDEKRCFAKCKIQDNSFFAKINNNRGIGAYWHVGKSKSGNAISAATITKIYFFEPSTGTYYPILVGGGQERTCATYKVYDAFRFMIDFITDGTVGFASDTFGPGGAYEHYYITNGHVLKLVLTGMSQATFEQDWPLIDFETLFKEIDKKLNIGFSIEYAGASPTIRIEAQDYFYGTATAATLSDVDELGTSVSQDALYSTIQLGYDDSLNAGSLANANSLQWAGFRGEEYHLLTTCNINQSLDLKGDWVVDSNSIEDAVVNGASDYDDKIFLIQAYDDSGNIRAYQSNWLTGSPPPYFYNENLTNQNVALRYFGYMPSSIAQFIGTTDNSFQANRTTNSTPAIIANGTYYVYPFDNEVSDPAGNYNNGTYRYIAPGSTSGVYSFNITTIMNLVNQAAGSAGINIFMYLRRYDTLNNLLATYLVDSDTATIAPSANTNITLTGTQAVYLDPTDYVNIQVRQTNGTAILNTYLTGGNFSCTATAGNGGQYGDGNDDNFPVLRHEITYPLPASDFDTIKADTKKRITFARNGQQNRHGWIESLQYDHLRGSAKFILSSSKNINR